MDFDKKARSDRVTYNMILMVIVILGVIFAWYCAWSAYDSKSSKEITTFDQCVEATGGAVMLSYPAQCAIDGKTFVDQNELNEINGNIQN